MKESQATPRLVASRAAAYERQLADPTIGTRAAVEASPSGMPTMTPEERWWTDRLRYAEAMIGCNRRRRRALGARFAVDHYVGLRNVCLQWFAMNKKVQP